MSQTVSKFALTAAFVLALTFTLSCSGDDGGNGNISTCRGEEYDTTIYSCEKGELIGSCRGNSYYTKYQRCENGEIKELTETSSSSLRNSSSSRGSSSSSSSGGGDNPSSSGVVPSSSSVVSSSSSAPPSSSSVALSSSSLEPSSSSSAPPSSSSVAPSSSSSVYDSTPGCCKWEAESVCYTIFEGVDPIAGKDGSEIVVDCQSGNNKFWPGKCPNEGGSCPTSPPYNAGGGDSSSVPSSSSRAKQLGSLWGPNTQDFPFLQVRVPDSTSKGGQWFGYKYSGGYAEVKLAGQFVEFVEGVSLTDENGSSLIDPDGLVVRLTARSETGGTDDYGEAGIGFNFKESNSQTEYINSYGGYCITYSSDGTIEFKLVHDENTYDYWCTFKVLLPPSSNRTLYFSFNDLVKSAGCDITKSVVLENAVGVKIGTPETNFTTPTVVNFTLHRLGWLNGYGCSQY